MRYAYSFVQDMQHAEDIVQETMLRLWASWDKRPEIGNIEGYAMRMARNISIDSLRKYKLQSDIELAKGAYADAADPMQACSDKDLIAIAKKAITELPEMQHQCFMLREEGRQYNEISDMLGISLDQVKVNIFRARNFIKSRIEKLQEYGIH